MSKSTFAPRPSTTIPPATVAYEPLAKSVLTHRLLYTVFAYSAAFSLATTVVFASDDINASFLLRLFRPSTWLTASLTWLVGVLPIVIVKKVFLTPTPEPAPSPSKTMTTALAKQSTRRCIAVYVASSLLLFALEFARIWSKRDDLRLDLFVKSRKYPYHLNGRLVFFALAHVWLAISFALRNVMRERFVFRWAKVAPSLSANLATSLLATTLFTLSSFIIYNVAFGLARLIFLPMLLRIPFVRSLLKPFVGHFIRGPWTLFLPLRHMSLELRTFTLVLVMHANWEFAESLFDAYIPQPVKVASTTVDPNVTLVSGITSSNPMYLHFSYAELCDIACENSPANSARRTALFSDQKFSPSLWNVLARESLLHLGRDYQTFLRRGAPLPPTSPTPAVAPKKPAQPLSTPLLHKPIYKPRTASPMAKVLDKLASDSELIKGADAVVTEVGTRIVDGPIPELFRSVSVVPAPPSTTAPCAPAPTAAPQPNLLSVYITRVKTQCRAWIVAHAPVWYRDLVVQWDTWWTRDRVHKLAEQSLPNRDLDALIVQVLTGLVCASLTEDRYGVVQRDIPRILEALVTFLTALEEYHEKVTKLYVPPTPDELAAGEGDGEKVLAEKERTRVEVARAIEAIGVVADALKSGVADVARTFGERLSAFKFPPRVASKLQTFVDYA